jgi:hypothetical protein
MKMQKITAAGEPMFEIYDASDSWVASFVKESDALLFVASKAKNNAARVDPAYR